jgi:hypothetical protein
LLERSWAGTREKLGPIFTCHSIDEDRFHRQGAIDGYRQSKAVRRATCLAKHSHASYARVLEEVASTVLVTTYQAGKLMVLRNDRGLLNTHFRDFVRPMGLAVAGGKLAIGTSVDESAIRKLLITTGN